MKIIASHQPHFNPYLGYFAKMKIADTFVLSNDVQFIKNGFIHRNRIRSWQRAQGWRWLTVPVSHHEKTLIHQVELAQEKWIPKLLNVLEYEYHKAPFYNRVMSWMTGILNDCALCCLEHLIYRSLSTFTFALQMMPSVRFASDIYYDTQIGDRNGRLIAITKALGGDAYLAGAEAARTYLNPDRFTEAGIKLLVMNYHPHSYTQVHGSFVPMLGVIDALMNLGPDVSELLGHYSIQSAN